jgi:hypothetical protein
VLYCRCYENIKGCTRIKCRGVVSCVSLEAGSGVGGPSRSVDKDLKQTNQPVE